MGDAETESFDLDACLGVRREGLEPIGIVDREPLNPSIAQTVPEPIGFLGLGVAKLKNFVNGVGILEDGHARSLWIESSHPWCLSWQWWSLSP